MNFVSRKSRVPRDSCNFSAMREGRGAESPNHPLGCAGSRIRGEEKNKSSPSTCTVPLIKF